jgi:broad specificity phosphatase PhoE
MAFLILIRHAATIENDLGIYMGQRDSQCKTEALLQANSMALEIATLRISQLFSSPLNRCLDTAAAILPTLRPIIDCNLAERNLGRCAGLSIGQIGLQYPEMILSTGELDIRKTPPEGESLHVFASRICHFIRMICEAPKNEYIAVVTHTWVISMLRYLVQGCSFSAAFEAYEPHLVPRIFEMLPTVVPSAEAAVVRISEI